MGRMWSGRRFSVVALGVVAALVAACGGSDGGSNGGSTDGPADGSGGGSSTAQVRAVLSDEDASDILPGSSGDFVVMVHLEADGSTIPLVMLTPRTATSYAPYLASGDSVYVMEVPAGAAWPLVDSELSWATAIISSESQLRPEVLDRTASELVVAVTVTGAEVDPSIIEWTQRNVSHMAGVYVISGGDCIPAVVRQSGDDSWLLTAIPGWNDATELAGLVEGASSLVISDSTKVNPSRIPACAPGG